jgi:thioredoxin-related protein
MLDNYKIILIITVLLLFSGISVAAQDIGVDWYELEEAQVLAKENDKKVLVYAEASWCTYCRKMEQQVLSKSDVKKMMAEYFYPVRVDIESDQKLKFNGKEMTQQIFARQMRVSGTPTFFFIDQEGSILGAQPGFIPKDIYQSLLTYVGTDTHDEISFEEYLNKK